MHGGPANFLCVFISHILLVNFTELTLYVTIIQNLLRTFMTILRLIIAEFNLSKALHVYFRIAHRWSAPYYL